jgi:hypothetical protein
MLSTPLPSHSINLSLSKLIAPRSEAFINCYANQVETQLEKYCRELGIWQKNFEEYITMSGYLFPQADSQRLFAIGLYNALLYFIDDQFDRHDKNKRRPASQQNQMFQEAISIFLQGSDKPLSGPILQTAQALHTAFYPLIPNRAWLNRFLENSWHHLQSSFQDIDEADNPLSWYERYLYVRCRDSGMAPTIDLIEFALGESIAPSLYQKPIVQSARDYVAHYCALSNDIFSYEKEVLNHQSSFNALVMLERDGYSLEAAVIDLINDLNQMLFAFQDLYETLKNEDHKLQLYMDGLWHQIVAAYHWQFSSNRYRSSNSPFIELRTVKS